MKRQQQEENDRQAELTRETLRVGSRREYPPVGGVLLRIIERGALAVSQSPDPTAEKSMPFSILF